MTLSIIVATLGRPGLERTLTSIVNQPLLDGDAVVVVGRGARISATASQFGAQFIECKPGGHGGAEERMAAMPHATTTHLAFLDDDDMWAPGARAHIAAAIEQTPTRPMIFRMQYGSGKTLWRDPVVRRGNVGTPMIVVPNEPKKWGAWAPRRMNDFYFLSSMKWAPREIVWRPEVIALIRPA